MLRLTLFLIMIYRIRHETKRSIVGAGDVDMRKNQDYHLDAPYSYGKIPLLEPRLSITRFPDWEVSPKTKLTDYLRIIQLSQFMVFSLKMNPILKQLNTAKIESCSLNVFDGQELVKYIGIRFLETHSEDIVRWDDSSFVKKGKQVDEETLVFKSYQEYLTYIRAIAAKGDYRTSVKPKRLSLHQDIGLDFFWCTGPHYGFHCTDRFIELVTNKKLTGFRFIPINPVRIF